MVPWECYIISIWGGLPKQWGAQRTVTGRALKQVVKPDSLMIIQILILLYMPCENISNMLRYKDVTQ